MKTATLGQMRKMLALLGDVPQEQLQAVLESGLLTDLLNANVVEVDRLEFRRVCGFIVFPVWRTIKLGTNLWTVGEFCRALKENAFSIGVGVDDMLGNPFFTVATKEADIDLFVVSAQDLGFKRDARRYEIYDRAMKLGLELCPAEVGPQLRLQYRDQPIGEWLVVAMKPIADSNGHRKMFYLGRDASGSELTSLYDDRDAFLSLSLRWVFSRRRK